MSEESAAPTTPASHLTDSELTGGKSEPSSPFHLRAQGKYWAVLCGEELICLTAYRKGALVLMDWLMGKKRPPLLPKGAAS